ncbi:MAG TPA: phospholipid carrier-dependent glycosyltransferase [Myxococcota bacterium]|nr:phospholipid carrier-dependent glycosyltransferase [Myxococcota bacterium]
MRACILVGAAALMLVGIQWGLPNVESWNGDDISPDKPLRVAYDWVEGAHKYPYLHWWLNAALYAPYVAARALLGQVDLGCLPRLVPSCFAEPVRDMTVLMVLSRLLSVAMGLGIVLGAERLARALHRDGAAALSAGAICAASATLVAFAHTANLDVPHAFWFTWSLVAAVRVWQRGTDLDYLVFGTLAGFALSTKDTIVGAYVLPGLALAGLHVARVAREQGGRGVSVLRAALLDRRFAALALLPLAIFALVQNAIGNPAGVTEHVRIWVEGGPVLREYRAHFHGLAHQAWRLGNSLEAALGAPMALLGVVGVVVAPLRHRALAAFWVVLASYALFSIVPGFVEPRVVLPLVPILAVGAGVLAAAALRARPPLRWLALAAVGAAFLHEVGVAVNADAHLLRDPRYEAERWIARNVDRSARIAALGGSDFMPRLEQLGFAPIWFKPSAIQPRGFEVRSFEYAILTWPYHPDSDEAWQNALRSGETGAPVLFDVRPGTPLDRWFGTRWHPGLTRPRITVVRLE